MVSLSIITINFNNSSGLEKTIKSVMDQTFRDRLEYIVIDGGSTDGSTDIINKYSNTIDCWVSEKDKGIYNAQNKGIEKASGDYCLFLNSGDFLCHENVIEKVFSYKLDQDIIYGNMRINWGNNSVSNGLMPDVLSVDHMFRDTLWHPVSFIKKSLFDTYGSYNENYKMVADYDFFFKVIIKHKVTTKHIPVYICEYNTEGFSSDPNKKNDEQEERRAVVSNYLSQDKVRELENKTKQLKNPILRFLKLFRS